MPKQLNILFIIAALVAAMSFTAPAPSRLVLHFENYVGNLPLKLDSATYKNKLGQTYTVSKFKYYISNIRLCRKGNSSHLDTTVVDGYYLINEEDPASKEIVLKGLPDGKYSSITFTIGVDSLHNCSGAQTGALDPVNAMFWAWNTGYIFLKMEGKSPVSTSPGNLLEFHIGGYRTPYNCIRTITLNMNSVFPLADDVTVSVEIKADLAELFKTPTSIDFSKLSSVTDFHNATTIADNYKDMFSIKQ